LTGLAIGYSAAPAPLPENLRQRDTTPRTRKGLSQLVFRGEWGVAYAHGN
jgi:hypothetical protein